MCPPQPIPGGLCLGLAGIIKADMDTDIHSLSTLLRAFPKGMSSNNRSMFYCLCTHFTDEETAV